MTEIGDKVPTKTLQALYRLFDSLTRGQRRQILYDLVQRYMDSSKNGRTRRGTTKPAGGVCKNEGLNDASAET